jgi:hypothetical protein
VHEEEKTGERATEDPAALRLRDSKSASDFFCPMALQENKKMGKRMKSAKDLDFENTMAPLFFDAMARHFR